MLFFPKNIFEYKSYSVVNEENLVKLYFSHSPKYVIMPKYFTSSLQGGTEVFF